MKPKILIINALTNEEELREMNADEFAQYEADKAEFIAKAAEAQAKAEAKSQLLHRLGITEDEAKLLLS